MNEEQVKEFIAYLDSLNTIFRITTPAALIKLKFLEIKNRKVNDN